MVLGVIMEYGKITQIKTYNKYCKPEHFMAKFQGYGISDVELEKIYSSGAKFVQIIYMGIKRNKIFLSHISQWKDSEKKYVDTSNGFEDPQTFLSEKDMLQYK